MWCWENEIMGRILPNSLESPLIKCFTISLRLFVRFYWNTLSILQKERYQYFFLSPFRISTLVFSLGTNSGHSPLPSGFLKMSQRYWRGTLKETYFSMLYPNSKKSWALILQVSLPFIAKYEKLSEAYQEWNWRIENESLQLVLFLFGNPQRVLKAPFSKEGRILAGPFQEPDNEIGKRKNYEGNFIAKFIGPKELMYHLWGTAEWNSACFQLPVSFPFGFPIPASFHLKAQGGNRQRWRNGKHLLLNL